MSDPITITTLILAAIPTTIASVVAAVMTLRTTKIAKQTHQLVNGSMLIQLQLHAKTARALANITPNDVHALEVADLAEKMLKEHQNKLSIIEGSMDKAKVEV